MTIIRSPERSPAFRVSSNPRRRNDDEPRDPASEEGHPNRLLLLTLVLIGLAATIVIRLYYLQILDHDAMTRAAASNQLRTSRTEAPRGRILASDGQTVLVDNRVSLSVGLDLSQLRKKTVLNAVVARLSSLLGISQEELQRRIDRPKVPSYNVLPIADDVSMNEMAHIKEYQEDFPGVVPIMRPVRTYPQRGCDDPQSCTPLAPHVIGYVGETNPADLKANKNLVMGDGIGRAGVEATLDPELRGTPGSRQLEVSSTGRTLRVVGEQAPVQGDDVVLTIDSNLQKIAEDALKQGIDMARTRVDPATQQNYKATAGSVVILDPRTGGVLAMASYPGYDPTQFIMGIPNDVWSQLNDPNNQYPLENRVLQGLYAPGSTFKVVTAMAGLSNGIIQRDDQVDTPGTFRVGGRVFHDWQPGGHGTTDLRKSLVESVDVYYYKLGYQMFQQRQQGDFLQNTARALGLGKGSGIDLPSEKGGRVPDGNWKRSVHNANPKAYPDGNWEPGDAVNLSIGQGDLVLTPLQLADIYAAIANGGTVWRPHVVQDVRAPTSGRIVRQAAPQPIGQLPVSGDDLDAIRSGLAGVPTEGTATSSFAGFPLDQYPIAGKTGTAQVTGKEDTSWFASYAPADDPHYAIVVNVEQAGHGGEVAAPISRYIYEKIFGLPSKGFAQGQVGD